MLNKRMKNDRRLDMFKNALTQSTSGDPQLMNFTNVDIVSYYHIANLILHCYLNNIFDWSVGVFSDCS